MEYYPSDPYDDDAVYGLDEPRDEEDLYTISQPKEGEDEEDVDELEEFVKAPGSVVEPPSVSQVDFNDPEISALPRILFMGPRRGGKSSIQVGVCR